MRPSTTTFFFFSSALAASLAAADEGESAASCPLAGRCRHGSACVAGPAEYGSIADYPYESPVPFLEETSRHGAHCVGCPKGHTGVTCKHKYEVCDEATGFVCFHGSKCVQIASGDGLEDGEENRWGCDCAGAAAHYAGTHCEHHWTDVCKIRDGDTDDPEREAQLDEEETWFCTNGGQCLEAEDNLLQKCRCADPWTGPHCEFLKGSEAAAEHVSSLRDQCSLDCKNGGECTFDALEGAEKKLKSKMQCVCPDGFIGPTCEVKLARSQQESSSPTQERSKGVIIGSVISVCSVVLLCALFVFAKKRAGRQSTVHATSSPHKGKKASALDTQVDRDEEMPLENDMEVVII